MGLCLHYLGSLVTRHKLDRGLMGILIFQTNAELGGKQSLSRILIRMGLWGFFFSVFAGVNDIFSLFVILIKSSLRKHKARVTFFFSRRTSQTAHQIANC